MSQPTALAQEGEEMKFSWNHHPPGPDQLSIGLTRLHGTITFNRRVVGCDTIAYAKRPDIYQLLAEPAYQPAVQPFGDRCQVLSAWREWGIYKVGMTTSMAASGPSKSGKVAPPRRNDAVCLVSMFIRQDPTSCLWVVPLGDWIASQTYAD